MNKEKIFSAGTIGLLSVLLAFLLISELLEYDKALELETISRVIEDNDYVWGDYLLPDYRILEWDTSLDMENNLGASSQYYEQLKKLFIDYDKVVIIEDIVTHDGVDELVTFIFLTKDPFEYETLSREFYYDMVGITIRINDKFDREPFTKKTERNVGEVYKNITVDGLLGIGKEKFKPEIPPGTITDYPTTFDFVDNEHYVFIKGFLTLDQAVEIAKVIHR